MYCSTKLKIKLSKLVVGPTQASRAMSSQSDGLAYWGEVV